MMRSSLAAIGLAGLACGVALKAEPPERPILEVSVPAPERNVQEASQSLRRHVYGSLREDGSRIVTSRKDALGKRVRVEGIAWGQPFGPKGQERTISPHAGPHVIHQGGSVFVKGIDFTETKARGKVVRVTGTLRLEPKSGTRFGDVPGYYYIEAAGFDLLEAMTDPHVVLVEE